MLCKIINSVGKVFVNLKAQLFFLCNFPPNAMYKFFSMTGWTVNSAKWSQFSRRAFLQEVGRQQQPCMEGVVWCKQSLLRIASKTWRTTCLMSQFHRIISSWNVEDVENIYYESMSWSFPAAVIDPELEICCCQRWTFEARTDLVNLVISHFLPPIHLRP